MSFAMDYRNHILTVPNITNIYHWECDLLSVTRALFTHEYEIKLNMRDYKREFIEKASKHDSLKRRSQYYLTSTYRIPNYFWFVSTFDLKVPEYAGWIRINNTGERLDLWPKKDAPRLHNQKLPGDKRDVIYTALAYRLKNLYLRTFKFKGVSHGEKEKSQ